LLALCVALAALGCSDDEETAGATAPPAQGALAITLGASPSAPAGSSCPAEHGASIGDPAPSLTSPGGRVADGQGASVSCTVELAEPFLLSAALSQPAISLSAEGTVPEGGIGTAAVRLRTAELGAELESPAAAPCSVGVDQGSLDVSPGRIWASLTCPALASGTTFCQATGVLVLENCAR
jgi:hypothetical protein